MDQKEFRPGQLEFLTCTQTHPAQVNQRMQMRRRDGYRIELLAGAVSDTLLSVIREHSHYAVNRSITQREIALWVSTDIHLFFFLFRFKKYIWDKIRTYRAGWVGGNRVLCRGVRDDSRPLGGAVENQKRRRGQPSKLRVAVEQRSDSP
ncbi:hypothetical protein DAPPUDRAFT_106449 [Daphnia pulex]|uniref:Uncharacterized protein n=1 Tax=Daphnia pulex TaxID=6669 RepID=E9GTT9_DAPPU|nr:hypothetical protein DAPPUDRAFT_106449 [Daphnia pulex]|eukprot:EFX77148.1 hypothetical protein DAPPUDRAFT_106449 [Daphnia pulex]